MGKSINDFWDAVIKAMPCVSDSHNSSLISIIDYGNALENVPVEKYDGEDI